ncbi:hypothetical protein B0H14DRAFT_2758762, partial [Mycena olivaceomarginata]
HHLHGNVQNLGCGVAIASSSCITEMLIGLPLCQAEKTRSIDIARDLSLSPLKLHCSTFLEAAIRSAAEDYRSKQTNPLHTTKSSPKGTGTK